MITKNDLYIILAELNEKGIDTSEPLKKMVSNNYDYLEIIKFINSVRTLELTDFYENIRKNYNKKRSKLYHSIVKDIEEPTEVLTTLSALLTQILLFSNKLENKQMFLRHARATEIAKVLTMYFINYDLTNCIKLLRLIKIDLKAVESIK